jgi:predicted kinase
VKIVHLVCGLPCSGKSTFARNLAKERRALHLPLDETLIEIYGQYSIDEVGHAEHVERVWKCRRVLWDIAMRALDVDIEPILDDGFFLSETRRRYAELCRSVGAFSQLYFLDPPPESIAQRLYERNEHLPSSNFHVSAERLAYFYQIFERPTNDEGHELFHIRE